MRDEGSYTPADSEVQAQVRALAIVACEWCDESGQRGAHVCDHIDRTAIYERGMAKVREALERKHA